MIVRYPNRIALAGLSAALLWALPANAQAPDFGTDSSAWSNDGECDDPRFTGEGMAGGLLLDADVMADATDCAAAFQQGTIQLADGAEPVATTAAPAPAPAPTPAPAPAPVTTTGPGVKGARAPVIATAPTAPATASMPVDYGDDSGQWTNDGECDDRRFVGQGMAQSLAWLDVGRDATDCQGLAESGAIKAWVMADALAATQCSALAGDDASEFANNGICDDPQFEGLGMDPIITEAERGHDATDCQQLCTYGAIAVRNY